MSDDNEPKHCEQCGQEVEYLDIPDFLRRQQEQSGNANDRQVDGDHYKSKSIEPWDYITLNGLTYLEGNVIKYVTRHRDKNGLADLEKAKHYLEKLIEMETLAGAE